MNVLENIARQIGERIHAALSSRANVVPSHIIEGEDEPADFEALAGIKDPASARFEIGETFEVWRLRAGAADEFVQTGEDLLTLSRSTGAYHHQVKVSTDESGGTKMAVAFARSWPIGPGQDESSVRDLFFSPLAATVDEGIERAEKLLAEKDETDELLAAEKLLAEKGETDERPAKAVVTRLLSLPEYKIEALWFITLEAKSTLDGVVRYVRSQVIVISAPNSFAEPTMSLLSSTAFLRALVSTSKGMGFLV
jgi:hypothetical protein